MRGRWWWAGLLSLVVIAALIAPRAAPPVRVSAAAHAAAAGGEQGELPPDPVVAQGAVVHEAASAAHGGDEIELCGGVWAKLDADGEIDQKTFERTIHLSEARANMLDSLRTDPSEFSRAAAIWLGLIGDDTVRAGLANLKPSATVCDTVECEAGRRAGIRFTEARDALVHMAATTNDPKVYALAFNACGQWQPPGSEGACPLLSAAQWARLEPDNASPWLFALTQAAERRDTAAQQEALYRISTARHSDQHFFSVTDLVVAHTPQDETSLPAALTLASEAAVVETTWVFPGYRSLMQMCKPVAQRDSNRLETCAAVAELLVNKSDSLLERGIGSAIGRDAGWPAEQNDRLRGERLAYDAAMVATNVGVAAGGATYGCEGTKRDVAMLRSHADFGEAGAMRQWIARSGKSPEEFIRIARESDVRRAAEAASAAAAASAASAASAAR